MENEEKVVKLSIPEGYGFGRVEGGEVILKKKEVLPPRALEECKDCIVDGLIPFNGRGFIPESEEKSVSSLVKLLICRDAWWKHLGWKPDWKSSDEKWSIYNVYGDVRFGTFVSNSTILAFPTEDVRNQFYETFKDLIEEAKDLL